MISDRQLIMKAVLENKLSPDHVTLEEIQELHELLFEVVAEKCMDRRILND